ncbi:hypothetical protein SAV14893_006650 [Streptomyces avermitilis]|uniref:Amine oxidase domain-containing protein n=1 Tax=Streptomyces avermitilis TaxID=33903 RepID=A0A4D4N2E3_STRAX|nr:hypothetical protein SAV14893_006650 [Streptomyces avermitilis]GDY78640.1 hypothetical protein SAV31267_081250 [Streptomyces avermitilis]GDY87468.1 hypothetical protein SAVCW2_66670 [Streptomyces avermitilis]
MAGSPPIGSLRNRARVHTGVSGAYAAWRLLGPEAERSRKLKELRRRRGGPLAVGLFQDWVQDPYGAACHFWQVGAKSWEVVPRMRHPLPDANLYVCGSAWSTGQGWVYGALTQAELMLEEHFGLAPSDVALAKRPSRRVGRRGGTSAGWDDGRPVRRPVVAHSAGQRVGSGWIWSGSGRSQRAGEGKLRTDRGGNSPGPGHKAPAKCGPR